MMIPPIGILAAMRYYHDGNVNIKAAALLSRIHKAFDVKIPLKEIFIHPTIRELAGYIEAAKREKWFLIEPAELKEYYPLSSAQKRLYILCACALPLMICKALFLQLRSLYTIALDEARLPPYPYPPLSPCRFLESSVSCFYCTDSSWIILCFRSYALTGTITDPCHSQ
jgi:hypothetical protein